MTSDVCLIEFHRENSVREWLLFRCLCSLQYKASKRLVKVMDALNGVVALLNQLVRLPPPHPPFAETVIIESSGKKMSLKGVLDEAAEVRKSVDGLFTILLSAKHGIIGSINQAIPQQPPHPPGAHT